MRNLKVNLLVSCCIVGGMVPDLAVAQLAGPATAAVNSEAQVEEITVTAQRRSETSQNVPVALSVISESMTKAMGVADTTSLQTAVPGLEFTRALNNATPALRGIGSNPSAPAGDESAVALYIDGVYVASPAAVLFSFNSIQQIEVLKGPQGTLFGRNATGGVVHVITKDPSFTPSGSVELGYGRFDTLTGNAYVTTPIASNIAADVAVHYEKQNDGWGKNLVTGGDAFRNKELAVRSKWLFTPGERTRITFAVDYDDTRGDIGVAAHAAPGTLLTDGVTGYQGFYNITENPSNRMKNSQGGAALKIDHDLDWAKLVSISSYRHVKSKVFYDSDQSPQPLTFITIDTPDDSYTQELQLLSPAGSPVQWIGGLFYFHDVAKYTPLTVAGPSLAPLSNVSITNKQVSSSYAGYGQATATILPETRLTLGLRYTIDKRRAVGFLDSNFGVLVSGDDKAKFPKLTYKAALDHRFGPDILGYASYSRGFKSGVFNLVAPGTPAVKPEVLDAYEVGFKSDLLGKKLRFNAALYYYEFKNLQVSIIQGTTTSLVNAAESKSKGVDADIQAVPIRNLRITAGLSYIDATFSDYAGALITTPSPAGGDVVTIGNAAGNRTSRVPKWTTNLSAQYTLERDEGDYTVSASYYYNDGVFWGSDNRLRNPSYQIVNASIGWQSANSGWNARLWGKNLLGEKYYVSGESSTVGDIVSPAAPLTFGATIGYRW